MDAIEDFQRSIGGPFSQVLQDNWIIVLAAIVVVVLVAFSSGADSLWFGASSADERSDADDGSDGGDGGGD